jgi:Flp pilus assembly protein CpaB
MSLTILAMALAIAFSGCSKPAAPAAAAAPQQQSNTSVEPAPAVPAAPELIEVWVAARDLPVGTVLTRDELPSLAVRKKLPKDVLPSAYVANLEEFIDRPLTRLAHKDATFDPHSFSTRKVVRLPEGLEFVSVSLPGHSAAVDHGALLPGAKADVLTTLNHRNGTARFPLLVDVLVLAADANLTNPPTLSLTFAVTQEQAILLALAKQRDCRFEILPRRPGEASHSEYDIKKAAALLQDDRKLTALLRTTFDLLPTSPPKPETFAPQPKELIEVWVAVSDIPPRAVITPQLVEAKLKKISVSKDRAEGAISDLTNLLEQEWTLGSGLRQGQWLTTSLVGPPEPVAKPEPEPLEVAPAPRVVKPKKYKDVTITSSSGRRIYRYEEVAPDTFKLVGVFAPEEGRTAKGRAPSPPKKGNR